MVDTNHNIKYLASSGGGAVIPWCYDTGVKYYCLYGEQEWRNKYNERIRWSLSALAVVDNL